MGRGHSTKTNGWKIALKLLKKYLMKSTKADDLLSDLPDAISSMDRRYCQFLFFGVIRQKGLIDEIVGGLLERAPRVGLRALLMMGVYEMMERGEKDWPKVVDFCVERAKELLSFGEARLVNAVLRRVPERLEGVFMERGDSVAWLSMRYSHPKWLVNRWLNEFGLDLTRKMLEWDQEPARVYLRGVGEGLDLEEAGAEGYYVAPVGRWDIVEKGIAEGKLYVQDPSTSVAPRLAGVKADDLVLDLCAAPGGKSMAMAESLKGGSGELVSLDLPGERILKLRENLARLKGVKYAIVEADLNEVTPEYLEALGLPGQYDVVLLDAPCSNTGVLRRRVDAKWRLQEGDISQMAEIQLKLLKRAGALVKPGGRLVYSTCSIENEENEGVVSAFLKEVGDEFERVKGGVSYPWVEGYDGGGAFLLTRIKVKN